MKIALLSKPLVNGAYQTKCEALAALPGVELTVIVPPSWREIGGWYDRSAASDGQIYSRLVRERGARYVPAVLGEHW